MYTRTPTPHHVITSSPTQYVPGFALDIAFDVAGWFLDSVGPELTRLVLT